MRDLLFVRARLQPCRKLREIEAASAAEGMNFEFSHDFYSRADMRDMIFPLAEMTERIRWSLSGTLWSRSLIT